MHYCTVAAVLNVERVPMSANLLTQQFWDHSSDKHMFKFPM